MTRADPTFRRGTLADILILCQLGQQLNALHHAERPDVYVAATSDFRRDESHWLPSLTADSQAAFIGELDGVAIGFITLHLLTPSSPLIRPQTVCRINSVCVAESMRSQGIGRSLMRLAQAWGEQHGAGSMTLSVWAFNVAAMALYEELGFEVRTLEMGKPLQPHSI